MTISVATGIGRILKQEGVEWVSTFPVCKVNNALGREGIPMVMMRDDRYAVALADAFSRINAGSPIGVATFPRRGQRGRVAGGLRGDGPSLRGRLASAVHHRRGAHRRDGEQPVRRDFEPEVGVQVVRVLGQAGATSRVHASRLHDAAHGAARAGGTGHSQTPTPLYDEEADPYNPVTGWKSLPNPADVARAVQLLMGAQDPLIYVGEGVIYAGASARS